MGEAHSPHWTIVPFEQRFVGHTTLTGQNTNLDVSGVVATRYCGSEVIEGTVEDFSAQL